MLARHYKADDVRINDMIYSIVKVLRTKCVLDEIGKLYGAVPPEIVMLSV